MGCWSAENATKAYLKTMKMGKSAKEPAVAEFISALAAGNNAQLMIIACSAATASTATASATTLGGLVAAAHQTGGRVICIVGGLDELHYFSQTTLDCNSGHVEFVVGEAQTLLLNSYREADLLVVDCNLENYEGILGAVQAGGRRNNSIVLGYNAFCKDSWRRSESRTQLLPIGEGLLLTRITAMATNRGSDNGGSGRKSHWVVKVDTCTGEEHVFRVRSPRERFIKA